MGKESEGGLEMEIHFTCTTHLVLSLKHFFTSLEEEINLDDNLN